MAAVGNLEPRFKALSYMCQLVSQGSRGVLLNVCCILSKCPSFDEFFFRTVLSIVLSNNK